MAAWAVLITAIGVAEWTPKWPLFCRFFSSQITKARQVTVPEHGGSKWEGVPDFFKGVKG